MRINVRATIGVADNPIRVLMFSGLTEDLPDWIKDHAPDADAAKVINDLFTYGMSDSVFVRFRIV